MPDELKQNLEQFVRFAQNLKGDEKGESQTFLDHFFRALGHAGAIEASLVLPSQTARSYCT